MLKIDIFDCNLTSWTLLENGCRQNLPIMTNFESLVCIQTEIEVITVCHFHSELFLNLNLNSVYQIQSKMFGKSFINHCLKSMGLFNGIIISVKMGIR